MDKLKALLKGLGVKESKIKDYFDDTKVESLTPDEDATDLMDSLKAGWENEHKGKNEKDVRKIESDLEAKIISSLGGQISKTFGVEKSKIDGKPLQEILKTLKSEVDGRVSQDVDVVRGELTTKEQELENLKNEFENEKTKTTTFIEEFSRDQFLIDKLSNREKEDKILIKSKQAFQVLKPRLFGEYAIVKDEKGAWDIRDKSQPTKKINKSKTEFLTLDDAIDNLLEDEKLLKVSNGAPEVVVKKVTDKKENGEMNLSPAFMKALADAEKS